MRLPSNNREVPVQGLFRILLLCVVLFSGCTNRQTEEALSPLTTEIYDALNEARNTALSSEVRNSHVLQAMEYTRRLSDDSLKLKAYIDVGRQFYRLGNYDKLYEVNSEILELSTKNKDTSGLARYYYNLGDYYDSGRGRIDSAYAGYFRSEQLYLSIGDYYNAGAAVLSMAIMQKNVRDYAGGEASSVRAIEYFSRVDDLRYLGSANNNLGLIANELGQFEDAIEYHQKALDYRRKLGMKALEGSSLNNIGIVFTHKKEYKEAITYFDRGLAYDSLWNIRPTTYVRLMDNRAYAQFLSGDMENLPQALIRPLQLRDSLNDVLGSATSNLHIAEYFFKQDSITEAIAFAKTSLEKSKQRSYHRGMLESLTLLSRISDAEEARNYALQHMRISDSLHRAERRFRDQFAKIRFETETLEIEKNKATEKNKWLTILLLSLMVSFLLIYIFIQNKLNRRKLALTETQQRANEEIYNLMLAQQTKLEEGRQLEKVRISEELHDGILGKLFGVRLSLDGLNTSTEPEVVETRSKYLDELKTIEDEIRIVSHQLNENVFSNETLYIDVVENLIESQCNVSKLSYDFEADASIHWEDAPNSLKVHLYRIMQEALQNIRKHAEAKQVTISFEKMPDHAELNIQDDGIGISENKVKKGIGLKNISSRVAQINGELSITGEKGKGTTISVKFNL